MRCTQCETENREGRRFCGACGAPLPDACPACGFSNEPGIRYCGGCGHDLTPSVAAAGATPAPPEAAPAASAATPEGERRQATILFSDLSGYTAMNERLDPEEVESIMSRIKAEAVRIVERHGGIVNQFVGDEVLALFGIPVAHEDDPSQAVRAALDLHRMARSEGAQVEEKLGEALRLHTGINSGLIVTNSDDVRDGRFGITGDTVNTGARLKALAPADEIWIGPETQKLVAPYFETEALPAVELKGKSRPVVLYRVGGEALAETHFEAAERRGLSRYVGRDRDLEILRERFERAERGEGQVVAVVGEAGVGKTRLLHELRTSLDADRFNQARGRCSAAGGNLSYLPFVDLLKRWFQIGDADTQSQMLEKTQDSLLGLDPDLEEHLPALLHLLSISGDRGLPAGMSGEVVQRKLRAALKACLLAGCRTRPLVMAFEDLHWVDASSATMLQQYIESIPNQPVLLLLSYRPEYAPPWRHYGHLTPLMLKPLDESATAAIVASTLNVETLPQGLAAVVHARTEGNPFFTEEVVSSLEEEGVVERQDGAAVLARPLEDISVPATVQVVVQARIDRLPEAPRDTLRLASVVGREFTETLVARLSETGEAIPRHLAELRTLELILEKRSQPELELMFKHAITHAVAYESLLRRRRKALHRLVGLGIEELYTERLVEHYETLAHHFDQGEVWDKAVHYLIKAGMKARQNYALQSATRFFDRAKEVLANEEPSVLWKTRYELHRGAAMSFLEGGQFERAASDFKTAEEIARDNDALEPRVQAMTSWANALRYGTGCEEALRAVREVEPLLAEYPTLHLGVAITKNQSYLHQSDLPGCLESEKSIVELLATAPPSFYRSLGVFWLSFLSRLRGEAAQYEQTMGPLLSGFREGPPGLYLVALFQYGVVLGELGRYQEAIDLLTEGRKFGLACGEKVQTPKTMNSLGWAFHELGLYDRALQCNQECLEHTRALEASGNTQVHEAGCMTRVNVAENLLALGDRRRARELLESVRGDSTRPEFHWNRFRWRCRCLLVLGELALHEGDPAQARAFLDEALADQWVDGLPMKKYQVRAARLQANIEAARGEAKAAERQLQDALGRAEDLGFPTQLWLTQRCLADVLVTQGRAEAARSHYRKARDVVQGIADGLTDPSLREGFLGTVAIRELVARTEAV